MLRKALLLLILLTLTVGIGTGCQSVGTGAKSLQKQISEPWQYALHTSEGAWVALAKTPSPEKPSDTLTVYIEGDGNAWLTRAMPSSDPTPRQPVALELAMAAQDTSGKAYIGRPCQFEARGWGGCTPLLWTQERYSPANVQAVSGAIDRVKSHPQQRLVLIGYSGGGVMAALLAAGRDDVKGFITVASNLDLSFWTDLHQVTPLEGSDDPLNYAERLKRIPQLHFAGDRDPTVPPLVVESFLEKLGLAVDRHLVVEAGFDHHCCWARAWPRIYDEGLSTLQSLKSNEDSALP